MHTIAQQNALKLKYAMPRNAPELPECECSPTIHQDSLGRLFERWIDKHFKNQKEAAEHFGTTQGFISNIVKGRKKPTKPMLKAMGLEEKSQYSVIGSDTPPNAANLLSDALETLLLHQVLILGCDTTGKQPIISIAYGPFCQALQGHEMWANVEETDDLGKVRRESGHVAIFKGCLIRWTESNVVDVERDLA